MANSEENSWLWGWPGSGEKNFVESTCSVKCIMDNTGNSSLLGSSVPQGWVQSNPTEQVLSEEKCLAQRRQVELIRSWRKEELSEVRLFRKLLLHGTWACSTNHQADWNYLWYPPHYPDSPASTKIKHRWLLSIVLKSSMDGLITWHFLLQYVFFLQNGTRLCTTSEGLKIQQTRERLQFEVEDLSKSCALLTVSAQKDESLTSILQVAACQTVPLCYCCDLIRHRAQGSCRRSERRRGGFGHTEQETMNFVIPTHLIK